MKRFLHDPEPGVVLEAVRAIHDVPIAEATDELAQLLRRIREHFDLSILLVEHHMNLVMRVSHKVVALEFGVKIADGTPDEVLANPIVVQAYLGKKRS